MTWIRTAWSWIRANPWAVAGVLAVVVIALLGVAWVLLGRLEAARRAWRGAEDARRQAEQGQAEAEDTADEILDAWEDDVAERQRIEEEHRERTSEIERVRRATGRELVRWWDGLRGR